MSRKGKIPIDIPPNVNVTINNNVVNVQGPKGKIDLSISEAFYAVIEDKKIFIMPKERKNSFEKKEKSLYGLTRMLIANMVHGVAEGYTKRLEIVGVGYKAIMKGNDIELNVGYSSPVILKPLPGISFAVEGSNIIVVSGCDKQKVGQVAADIREIRLPEPYKGKGIRYKGEVIKKKAGKAGVTTAAGGPGVGAAARP